MASAGSDNKATAGSSEEETSMKDKAYKICREYLGGTWKNISSSDMIFRPIVGGLSSHLYLCSLPETQQSLEGEPERVLLRTYGEIRTHRGDITILESVIFTLLSERKLGPKLYGIFPGGRLEEYIPSRIVSNDEQRSPEISAQIARKMAKFHMLRVPINKTPSWIFDNLERWSVFIVNNTKLESVPSDKRSFAEKFFQTDLVEEVAWLKSYLAKVESPVVFCHNDLQRGNILLPDEPQDPEDKLLLIDYEDCSYNYRGYDIAMHFCEWSYDIFHPEYPHFIHYPSNFPTMKQQLNFVNAYLDGLDPPVNPEESKRRQRTDTVQHLLQEINVFVLACHLIAAFWGGLQHHTSQIKFGFLEFAASRLDDYFKWKHHLLSQEQSETETPI